MDMISDKSKTLDTRYMLCSCYMCVCSYCVGYIMHCCVAVLLFSTRLRAVHYITLQKQFWSLPQQ